MLKVVNLMALFTTEACSVTAAFIPLETITLEYVFAFCIGKWRLISRPKMYNMQWYTDYLN